MNCFVVIYMYSVYVIIIFLEAKIGFFFFWKKKVFINIYNLYKSIKTNVARDSR